VGGKSSSNDEITNLQKEQADEARAKDAARQARINAGLSAIQDAFKGKAKYTTRATPGTVLGATGALPAGYTRVQVGGTPGSSTGLRPAGGGGYDQGSANLNVRGTGGGTARNAPIGSTAGVWKVRGPDGKIYDVGSTVGGGSEQVFTGRTPGGFDDNFYNEYNKGVTDYLLPQVTDQYTDAKNKTEYDLARAGTGKSSAANETFADLAKQKENQETDVRKTADTATGALRTRVANEEAKLQAQLYATENPDVASNQALAAVKNISLDTPNISPLGEVFKTALIGGANAITGYKNQQQVNNVRQAANAAKVYGS
jgi:hypothetical protein